MSGELDYDDYDDYDYDDDSHGLECDCEDCTYERHASECGLLPDDVGGGCLMAGTEYCDFDCPFRDEEEE